MTESINAGLDRLTQDQPPPQPGGVDVICDLAGRVATSGAAHLDDRTSAIVLLLLDTCCPVAGRTAQLAWLCAELGERRRVGIARYGTPLQAHNGRDPEADLRQELLDAAAYSHQAAIEAGE